MPNVVWVLGAGFSRSLGGPLLTDLLSVAARDRVAASYPPNRYDRLHNSPAEIVRTLFANYGPHAPLGQSRWTDAEQFLGDLDAASIANPGAPSLVALSGLVSGFGLGGSEPLIRALASSARRLMAAECCAFLEECDPSTERWDPYVRWISLIGKPTPPSREQVRSTVISFNYDRVVDVAAETAHVEIGTILPSPSPNRSQSFTIPGCVNVLKLHGSVNWKKSGSGRGYQVSSPLEALTCPDEELVIATPGPGKRKVASEDLCELWTTAENVLVHADAVVFVGYRFPPSDSEARRRILDALARNRQPHLFVHTALGPNTGDPQARRLGGMLAFALDARDRALRHNETLPRYTVTQHPLYAEDFLDVFDPRDLTRTRV